MMTIFEFDMMGSNRYKRYTIDRHVYPTIDDLRELAFDCFTDKVYLIRCYIDGQEAFTIRH